MTRSRGGSSKHPSLKQWRAWRISQNICNYNMIWNHLCLLLVTKSHVLWTLPWCCLHSSSEGNLNFQWQVGENKDQVLLSSKVTEPLNSQSWVRALGLERYTANSKTSFLRPVEFLERFPYASKLFTMMFYFYN